MPDSVDNRVVSMRFDNEDFERRIAQTLDSLSKLKGGMNFEGQTKGLKDLSNAASHFSLAGMASGIEHIASKFSVMGVAGFTAIQTLTSEVIHAAGRMASALIDPIRVGGKQRAIDIEQAKFQFRGLGIDVTEAMANAKAAVLGTAFGLNEAAKAAAQLGASGIKTGDSMTSVLRAIAGTAAMTGSSFTEIAQIFTGSAAIGKVTNQDLQQFGTRGLNAAAAVAKQLGVTEAQVHQMATDGKLDFKTFSDAMDKAFGAHATKANETFTGSLANMHAALSRMGAAFFGLHIDQERDLFNALTPDIDNLTKALQPLIDAFGFLFGVVSSELIKKLKSNLDFKGLTATIKIFAVAFVKAVSVAHDILVEIHDAFKDVFPASAASTLRSVANTFGKLVAFLKPAPATLSKIHIIFRGIFDALAIGIQIVKSVFSVFKTLFDSFEKVNGGSIIDFFVRVAREVTKLKIALVNGGGIQDFVDKFIKPIAVFLGSLNFSALIAPIINALNTIKNGIVDFFSGLDFKGPADKMSSASDRLADRWGWLITVGHKLVDFGKYLLDKLGSIATSVTSFFGNIAKRLADTFSGADISQVTDALNTGIFAVLTAAFAKFVHTGFKFNIGGNGGLLNNISQAFGKLTGVLQGMQAKLRAEALQKLAIAIAILTASIVAISLIDSAALTKAMSAIAIGFGELASTMAILNKIAANPQDAVKMGALALGLILVAGAIGILSIAVTILSKIDTAGLAKGITSVGILLGELDIFLAKMPDTASMIATGIGLVGIGSGITILSVAMKILSTIDLGNTAKGLSAIAVLLGELAVATHNFPEGMIAQGLGLIAIGLGLNILSGAIAIIGNLQTDTIVKGLLGIAGALAIVAGAMALMPPGSLIAMGAGLNLVGSGLIIISGAIAALGALDLGSMIQGLAGVAAVLAILAVATFLMQGTVIGSASIAICAGALVILAGAISIFGKLSIAQFISAIIEIVVVLGILAVGLIAFAALADTLSESLLPMLALAAVLVVVAVGVAAFAAAAALIGIAVFLIADALKLLASVGTDGVHTIIYLIQQVVKLVPIIAKALVETVVAIVKGLVDALPDILKNLSKVIGALIQLFIDNIPKFGEAVSLLIETILTGIQDNFPQLVTVGFQVIQQLLDGIDQNIGSITDKAIDILDKFLNTLAKRAGDITKAGVNLLVAFLKGVSDNIGRLINAGADFIIHFIKGVGNNIGRVINAGGDLIINFIKGTATKGGEILNAGASFIIKLMKSITSNVIKVTNAAGDILIQFLDGMATAVTTHSKKINKAANNLIGAIIDGLVQAIKDDGHIFQEALKQMANDALKAMHIPFRIHSPSKAMIEMGHQIVAGFVIGINNHGSAIAASGKFSENVLSSINGAIFQISESINGISEFSPTITPVVDLTNVHKSGKDIKDILTPGAIGSGSSFKQASAIAVSARDIAASAAVVDTGPKKIEFNQTNNSPKALSTAEVYRQTKSQLALAKKELSDA